MFPINKDTTALFLSAAIVIGFFVGGIFDVLHYFIIKALLFSTFGLLFLFVVITASKEKIINKKRLDD